MQMFERSNKWLQQKEKPSSFLEDFDLSEQIEQYIVSFCILDIQVQLGSFYIAMMQDESAY